MSDQAFPRTVVAKTTSPYVCVCK